MKLEASILLLAFTATSAVAECDFTVGETIQPLEPHQVFSFINDRELERNAFETTSEHESRAKDALDEVLPQSQSIAIFTNRDRSFLGEPNSSFNYDVENQRILYDGYFFSNSGTFSADALLANGLIGEAEVESFPKTGFRDIGLLDRSMSDEKGVYDKIRNVLSLAEVNDAITDEDDIFKTEVSAEMPSILGSGVDVKEVMTFNVPREKAKEMFADIMPVVSFIPAPPFVIRYDDHINSDRENDSVNITSYHLIGKISCGLIVSPAGVILDIAEVR